MSRHNAPKKEDRQPDKARPLTIVREGDPDGRSYPSKARKVIPVGGMRFRRHQLPVGGDSIPVLVSSEDGDPKAVFMSYEAFLELAATLYTAIEALRVAGIDPDTLFSDDADMATLLTAVSNARDDDDDGDETDLQDESEGVLRQLYPVEESVGDDDA